MWNQAQVEIKGAGPNRFMSFIMRKKLQCASKAYSYEVEVIK